MGDMETGREFDQVPRLLQQYFEAVTEIQKDTNISRPEKLKRLLSPLLTLYEGIESTWKTGSAESHKFASEDHISLDDELDLERLDFQQALHGYASKGSLRWRIRLDMTLDRRHNIVPTASKIVQIYPDHPIHMKLKHSKQKISIKRFYDYWLPTLTEQNIKSKDLLDQILVCYTIKRAQNGDNKAADKLCGLYEKRACSNQTLQNVIKLIQYDLSRQQKKNFTTPVKEDIPPQNTLETSFDDEFEEPVDAHNTSFDSDPTQNVIQQASHTKDSYTQMKNPSSHDDDFSKRIHEAEEEHRRPIKPNLGNLPPPTPIDDMSLFTDNAKDWLYYIICGITPNNIISRLFSESGDEDFAVPTSVANIYITYFCEYVPKVIEGYLELRDHIRKYIENMHSKEAIVDVLRSVVDLSTELGTYDDVAKALLDFFENEYAQSDRDIILSFHLTMMKVLADSWKGIPTLVLELLNPYTPISDTILAKSHIESQPIIDDADDYEPHDHKREPIIKMLSFCYRPDKMGPRKNLTTWLFGGRGKNYKYGKLYQALKEHYLPSVRGNVPSQTFADSRSPADDADDYDPTDPESSEEIPEIIVSWDYAEKALNHLMSMGVSKRNAEIFLKKEIHGIPTINLQQEHNVTPRQIQRICKKINELIGLSK